MAKKPTTAQLRVLDEMMKDGQYKCFETYKPALGLIEHGLAEATHEKFGSMTIKPTDLARKNW